MINYLIFKRKESKIKPPNLVSIKREREEEKKTNN